MGADLAGDLGVLLDDGQSFGRPGCQVERIVTHAAVVFLVGDLAYKLKRPVRYSFLDFSTVARRHAALESELRLNRRTAPGLYRRLVPVTRAADGRLTLDGPGEVVDWLLEMRRFDQDALLDRLALRGALGTATIDRLAREIARFHERAEPRPGEGGHAGMAAVVAGDREDLGRLAGTILDPGVVGDLDRGTRAELDRQRGRLEARRAAGKVRHCHGDLHLRNIVLLDGQPVLFDCLEFDPALASIDVLYDLAFLLMDLLHRDLRPLAQRLLSRYLDVTGDDAGLALLPLFLSVRAAIRAKILGLALLDAPDDPVERGARRGEARDYLARALAFLGPPPPCLIAVGGLSGTGKTTLAGRLAPAFGPAPGAVLVRSDVARKALFRVEPTTRLGQSAYGKAVTGEVYAALLVRAAALLRAGHAVVVDAVFLDPGERVAIEQVARDAGVAFAGLWLQAPRTTLEARVDARQGDASDATAEVVRFQLGLDPGPIAWARIEADGDREQVAGDARSVLAGLDSGVAEALA